MASAAGVPFAVMCDRCGVTIRVFLTVAALNVPPADIARTINDFHAQTCDAIEVSP